MAKDNKFRSRRKLLKTVGTVGVGIGGVNSLIGNAAADESGSDSDSKVGTEGGNLYHGGGGLDRLSIPTDKREIDISIYDVCKAVTVGAAVLTVFSPAPGDEALAAKVLKETYRAGGICTLADMYLLEHDEERVDVAEVTESVDGHEKGDMIIVPHSMG